MVQVDHFNFAIMGSGQVSSSLSSRPIFCTNCGRSALMTAGEHLPQLTERQRQCLEGFIARKTAKQIGRDLGITHHAVEQHLKAARKKLDAANTLEAARKYASAHTMVEPYYAASEVPDMAGGERYEGQPRQEHLRLRDIATEAPGLIQGLSPRQTLAAIGLSAVGMITILTLIVAVANGVAQLTP